MLEAALFGAIAQSALVVGALLVWKFPGLKRPKIVGALMAFGAGAVISAVAVDLVAVSYDEAGAGPPAIGIGIGCLIYFGIIALLVIVRTLIESTASVSNHLSDRWSVQNPASASAAFMRPRTGCPGAKGIVETSALLPPLTLGWTTDTTDRFTFTKGSDRASASVNAATSASCRARRCSR